MRTGSGRTTVADRFDEGVLDTCVFVDLGDIDPQRLPRYPEITSVTMAELHQGVATAKEPVSRAQRTEKLQSAVVDFAPLPFDGEAAARYGTLVALTLAADRGPKPRRMDLMIAAVASVHGLPLYTRNADDFVGLDSAVRIVSV
jgi:predicted nucleic acid-binding protein